MSKNMFKKMDAKDLDDDKTNSNSGGTDVADDLTDDEHVDEIIDKENEHDTLLGGQHSREVINIRKGFHDLLNTHETMDTQRNDIAQFFHEKSVEPQSPLPLTDAVLKQRDERTKKDRREPYPAWNWCCFVCCAVLLPGIGSALYWVFHRKFQLSCGGRLLVIGAVAFPLIVSSLVTLWPTFSVFIAKVLTTALFGLALPIDQGIKFFLNLVAKWLTSSRSIKIFTQFAEVSLVLSFLTIGIYAVVKLLTCSHCCHHQRNRVITVSSSETKTVPPIQPHISVESDTQSTHHTSSNENDVIHSLVSHGANK